jgi:hypothetical protein
MTPKDILNRTAARIEKHGLSVGTPKTGNSLCTAVNLVRASYDFVRGDEKFFDKEYTIARNLFCGQLGINSSYESITQWNDDFQTDKTGKKVYKRTQEEVVRKLREAAILSETASREKKA